MLATDTQKNTVYAFAKEHGVGTPEEFALRLARHFLGGAITRARVQVVEVAVGAAGRPRVRAVRARAAGRDRRLLGGRATLVRRRASSELVVLKTTDSEFHGFPRDRYTTLAETTDRVLATAVAARWRHDGDAPLRRRARRALLSTRSPPTTRCRCSRRSTRWATAVLEACPTVHEVRLSMPNKHHFVVDLSPFGLENPNEVFHADDRPYGLIEGAVRARRRPRAGSRAGTPIPALMSPAARVGRRGPRPSQSSLEREFGRSDRTACLRGTAAASIVPTSAPRVGPSCGTSHTKSVKLWCRGCGGRCANGRGPRGASGTRDVA